ncbi:MAG: hypothetical protein PHV39_07170 [Methanomicrobium sp.]|nr:hypothetical protein [Methanomicrobium sp.]
MKFSGKIITIIAALSIFMAICTPVSAQTGLLADNNDKNISIDIFAKDKNIQSGENVYIAATIKDENGEPLVNQTALFFQNIEISGINVDQYIGDAQTNEEGIAIFGPSLSVIGDSGIILIGCATKDTETGQAYYSNHIMITVTNPYPYIESDDDSMEE